MPDATTSRPSSTTEKSLYHLLRIGIALAGLFWILATISSHFVMPDLFYDERPVPPLRARLPGIVLSLGIGLLLCVPHRWTFQNWLFWPRLAAYVLLGVYLFLPAGSGILKGLRGEKSWHIIPVSVGFGCIGLGLPLCLLWSRRLVRVRR